MSYPRYVLARQHKFFSRLAGNLSLNSTTWADLPTITTSFDIILQAEVGDVVKAETQGHWSNEAVVGCLDVVTIVAAAAVNSFSTLTAPAAASEGIGGWFGPASAFAGIGGSARYTLVAGDLAAGFVTLRLRYRTTTAAVKTLQADANHLLQFSAQNLGPIDPN